MTRHFSRNHIKKDNSPHAIKTVQVTAVINPYTVGGEAITINDLRIVDQVVSAQIVITDGSGGDSSRTASGLYPYIQWRGSDRDQVLDLGLDSRGPGE